VDCGLHGIRVFLRSPHWRRSRTLRAFAAIGNENLTAPTSGVHFRGERKKRNPPRGGFFRL
jgi:hypothetical protein